MISADDLAKAQSELSEEELEGLAGGCGVFSITYLCSGTNICLNDAYTQPE